MGLRRLSPLLLLLAACRTFPGETVAVVQTEGGEEVAATTTHGLLFAGRTASKGVARVAVWFGDGAAVETGEVGTVAPGLATVPLPIATPRVEISVEPLRVGDEVLVAGRRGGALWTSSARIASLGPPRLDAAPSLPPSGGLVYRWEDERWRLAGLIDPAAGGAFAGPETLWRFLFLARPLGPPPFPPKRPDVR